MAAKNNAGLKKRTDPSPLYFKLQRELQGRVESGQWGPGFVIPTERSIAKEYGVSLGTVRKAMLNLVAEGFLYRVQGRGTMVAGTTMIRESLRYYRIAKDFGKKEAALHIEFISIEVVAGLERISRLLKISPEDELYLLKRRLLSQKSPIVYSISYFPRAMLEGLDKFSQHLLEKVPIYLSIEGQFGIPTISNQELIGVASADQEVSQSLGVNHGDPLLTIEMLSMTYKARPYEYRLSYCRGDRGKVIREY